ncbi:MAG TPA: DUF1775 domain-containing protein [Solirubrobacteraceae bacterium]|nr:DUF1775 domain-containing protein [Solirubrobacteraceae bacterium]
MKITEPVARIVWTGNPRMCGIVKPGQFEEFPISTQVPQGAAGSFLTFKAYQTYRDGERVRWSGGPEAEHPAPRVKLLAPAPAARRSAGS